MEREIRLDRERESERETVTGKGGRCRKRGEQTTLLGRHTVTHGRSTGKGVSTFVERCTPFLNSFHNVAFETVPMLV